MALIKVISLIQPWASLAAWGEKKIETRSWKTNYRGPLAIHASKKIDHEICKQDPFRQVLAKHGITDSHLPTGVILAAGNMVDCVRILDNRTIDTKPWTEVQGNEFFFGDYTPGRFAWLLENMQLLENPIPAKGKLNLWEFNI